MRINLATPKKKKKALKLHKAYQTSMIRGIQNSYFLGDWIM